MTIFVAERGAPSATQCVYPRARSPRGASPSRHTSFCVFPAWVRGLEARARTGLLITPLSLAGLGSPGERVGRRVRAHGRPNELLRNTGCALLSRRMPLSTKSLNAEVAAANVDMSLGAEPGKKKVAGTALKRLAELLATGEGARAHAAMICENRLREGSAAQAPTWDGVLSRVIFLLSVPNKLAKNDVEKLRSLVGAAVGAGPGAMSSKAELKVFCYVCEELCDAAKTPPRADRTSAHPRVHWCAPSPD